MAKINLKNISKHYGQVIAVRDVTLDIRDGEIFGLLGPSGCGKSTILKMICGLEDVTEGVIRIDDMVVNHLPPKDHNVSMVFQNPALFPHMSVFGNIEFPLKVKGVRREARKQKVHAIAEKLRIRDLLKRYPHELSGGEKQRVALGSALVTDPHTLLLDEQFSNLDAKLREELCREMKDLLSTLNAVVIYVTHDQQEAMLMCDRIAVMSPGLVEQVGNPTFIYHHPCTRFVAEFIGSPCINMFTSTIVPHDRGYGFTFGETVIPILVSGIQEYIHRRVVIGIRPEDIVILDDIERGHALTCVDKVQPMGHETFLTLFVAHQKLIARITGFHPVRVGDTVTIRLNIEHVHFFNEAGECLASTTKPQKLKE